MSTVDTLGYAFKAIATRPSTGERYEPGCWMGCSPHIEIAWDLWARTRIICDHGTFEGVSRFLNLQESFDAAIAQFNAFEHIARCYRDTPVPTAWTKDGTWSEGDTTECDLWDSHDGPCVTHEDYDFEDEARKARIVMCTICRRQLAFQDDPRAWVHKDDRSARCQA